MADDVQLPEPAADLLAVATRVSAPWLRRGIVRAASSGGADATEWDDLDHVVTEAVTDLLAALERLLATDVDEQRDNPLSLFRRATAAPTALLKARGVPAPRLDRFAADHFPDDPYQLGPATWNDIDDEMQTPGLTWGAWKAITVLQRRRDEGLR